MFRSVLPSAVALKVMWHYTALPTSYLAECVYIWVTYLLSNICNCLAVVNT